MRQNGQAPKGRTVHRYANPHRDPPDIQLIASALFQGLLSTAVLRVALTKSPLHSNKSLDQFLLNVQHNTLTLMLSDSVVEPHERHQFSIQASQMTIIQLPVEPSIGISIPRMFLQPQLFNSTEVSKNGVRHRVRSEVARVPPANTETHHCTCCTSIVSQFRSSVSSHNGWTCLCNVSHLVVVILPCFSMRPSPLFSISHECDARHITPSSESGTRILVSTR